jgi:hypothetical protein
MDANAGYEDEAPVEDSGVEDTASVKHPREEAVQDEQDDTAPRRGGAEDDGEPADSPEKVSACMRAVQGLCIPDTGRGLGTISLGGPFGSCRRGPFPDPIRRLIWRRCWTGVASIGLGRSGSAAANLRCGRGRRACQELVRRVHSGRACSYGGVCDTHGVMRRPA